MTKTFHPKVGAGYVYMEEATDGKWVPLGEYEALVKALDNINKIIFANSIYVGSPEYFAIRENCVKHLK